MTELMAWRNVETFILRKLELFNWGGFNGLHQAIIDPSGTAIIGPTGSGKTTLIDALMTLLCANPKYNLASTGGHESDRDLVSYVRGVSGPGDGRGGQSHISRPNKTVTGIAATLEREGEQVTLGALLWFDDTSSTATDMKKLWIFSSSCEHTLTNWISQHHEGGMRALRQMEKDFTGIWTYPSKKNYLARLRDYFEVGENAFTLLNRAAGLKQLNSIDEIFRELVLDDRSSFDRAAEVVASFDDLTDIHQELEIARRQQQSLLPIAEKWSEYQDQSAHLHEKKIVADILPVWFAEQLHRLWKSEEERLKAELKDIRVGMEWLDKKIREEQGRVDTLRDEYHLAGGANIEDTLAWIEHWETIYSNRRSEAQQYQRVVKNLDLPDTLSEQTFAANQDEVKLRLVSLDEEIAKEKTQAYHLGAMAKTAEDRLKDLRAEQQVTKSRPSSNVPHQFQVFRGDLATQLSLSEEELPFVGELVQVKAPEARWRGAIERAIGSNRLRVVVPPGKVFHSALKWVNERHNRLHVRLLEFSQPTGPIRFFEDGYSQKLDFKKHPYVDAVRALVADNDRHCVRDVEELQRTPHAMTAEGSMSGKARFFEKQDQRNLADDWITGFDNRDRLAQLSQQIQQATEDASLATSNSQAAQGVVARLEQQAFILRRVGDIKFESIDLPGAEEQLSRYQDRHAALTRPDSDAAIAKSRWEQAVESKKAVEEQRNSIATMLGKKETLLQGAEDASRRSYQRAEQGITGAHRELAARFLPHVNIAQLDEADDIERESASKLRIEITGLNTKISGLKGDLIRKMSDAKDKDTGALSEAGRDLEDIPIYLERLRVLTEEALPEKLARFLDYLNRSSDEGVTQLLSVVEQEVAMIIERLDELNKTLRRVDFQTGHFLRLVADKVAHESIQTLQRALRQLNNARFAGDDGETQYKALQALIALLRDACERNRTHGAKALLDPRFRLEFSVAVIDKETGRIIETRRGSQGGSGGEKEIIASYVLTASLAYALCPGGSSRPLFGTIILDEAFSRSSNTIANRIIAALREFGLHAVFITPNKELRLLRRHTRSAIVVHRRGTTATLASLSWEALDAHYQQSRSQ